MAPSSSIIFGLGIIFIGFLYYLFMSQTSQVLGFFPYRFKTDKKIVALTFDDGPNPPYTLQLLEVLNRHQIKATFFLVGKNLEKFPEVGRSILERGHTLGNHSYSHSFLKYFTEPSFVNEIRKTQAVFRKVLNLEPSFFRSPWLFRHPLLLRTVRKGNLFAVGGIFASEVEVLQPSASKIAARALARVRPGSILIFHDGFGATPGNRSETVAAIDLLIIQLKQQGYEFVTVDSLKNSN